MGAISMTEDQAQWEYFRSSFRKDHPNSAAAIGLIDDVLSHASCTLEDHRRCGVLALETKRFLYHTRMHIQRTGDWRSSSCVK